MKDVQTVGMLVCSVVSIKKYVAMCVSIDTDVSLVCHLFTIDLVLLKNFSKPLSLCMMDPIVKTVLAEFNERDWHFTTI